MLRSFTLQVSILNPPAYKKPEQHDVQVFFITTWSIIQVARILRSTVVAG